MPAFRTAMIVSQPDAKRRLADWGLNIDQILAVRDSARAANDDASPLMPLNAPGTLGYIHGVGALRAQLLDANWVIDRTLGVEAVINAELRIRIGYQNVDRACDAGFPPMPRSDRGSGMARLCRAPLFEFFGVPLESDADRLPAEEFKDPLGDEVATYFVMVGEDGSVEVSRPVITSKKYDQFIERIFVDNPSDDWGEALSEPGAGPLDDFDVPVTLRDSWA